MAKPRFFLPSETIDRQSSQITVFNPIVINQIRRVLRLKRKDKLSVLDGQGYIYNCQIETVAEAKVELSIEDTQLASGDPEVGINVALSLIKSNRFDWAVEKLTELGIRQLTPIISQRTVIKHQSLSKLVRWQAIACESAEQCERATIPQIVNPVGLETFLVEEGRSQRTNKRLSLICTERRDTLFLPSLLSQLWIEKTLPQSLSIVIGPEGGFTEAEINLALQEGFHAVSLGRRILRSETAAIFAAGQIISVCGGL